MNLNKLLDHSMARWPDKIAVVEGDQPVSYAALADIISDFETRLIALALPHGCRVGLHIGNSINYIALTYALWRLEAVVVPIPIECPAEEVAVIIEKMELTAVLSFKPQKKGKLLAHGCYFARLKTPAAPDNHGLKLAFIRFTSGTTSARKGVALCHQTIHDRIKSANKSLGIGLEDVVMWNLPMAHHFLITIVLYLSEGATVVLARHTRPRSFLSDVNLWRCTVLYAAPRYFALLAQDNSGLQIPSVRLAISTTSSLTEEIAKDFFQRFNQPLLPALGVIEIGLVAVNLKDPLSRCHSVGRAAGDMRVSVIDPDSNGCGELAVYGPGMLDAYVAPWIPQKQILQNGWFCTGDIVRLAPDGYIHLLSRKTSVINRAGQKIFPEEVEAVINRYPGVLESRVYGRHHPLLGETVEADLVLEHEQTSLAQIRAFCREQLAAHKIPVCLNVVTELPRTTVTGKISRISAL